MEDLRLLVVGAGAIGGVIAAGLARAGCDVTLLDANREHVERMRDPGLSVQEPGGTSSTVRLIAERDPDDLHGRFDVAMVTVKAPHLEAALESLVTRDLVETYLALGNGLVHDRLERLVGRDRLVVGTVEWGATNMGPGRLAQTTHAPFVLDARAAQGPHGPRLRTALEHVAPVRLSGDITGQVWSKLLVNSTFSGLGAVTGLLYGEVVESSVGRRVAFALWTEGVAVAYAAGVRLPEVLGVSPESLTVRAPSDLPTAERSLRVLMGAVAATKASMLQDLERGAVTEVDDINGAVVRRGAAVGVPAPANQRIVEVVHACERGERRPDPSVLDELAALVPGVRLQDEKRPLPPHGVS
jgi:2-dehydropantoate 2-reductase